MIKPTIGRIVHFRRYYSPDNRHTSPPSAALIIDVHDNNYVAIKAFHNDGSESFHPTVRLIQSNEIPPSADYCTWPPRETQPHQSDLPG